MSDKQIQTVRRDVVLSRQARPRGLIAQASTILLQPGVFFRTLLPASDTRQWLWIGMVILLMIGLAAVRYQTLIKDDTSTSPAFDFSGEFGGDINGGGDLGAVPVDPFGGGIPGDIPAPGGETDTAALDTTSAWTTALLAASGIILGWLVQIVLLCVVPMVSGYAPRLGANLQVAVWASLPLALMAALQLMYFAAGGTAGAPGLRGLAEQIPWYPMASPLIQGLVDSLLVHLTLFWLWSFILFYFGARYALSGTRAASILATVAWVVVLICVPPILSPPAPVSDVVELLPPEMEMMPEGALELPSAEIPFSPESEQSGLELRGG